MLVLWFINHLGEQQDKHQVGYSCSLSVDIAIHAQEILKTRKILNDLYVKHTGQSLIKIESVMERDHFMSASEALTFGIVDKVIEKRIKINE